MPITDSRWSGATTKVIETETGADGLTIADAGVVGELIDNGGAVYNARAAGAVASGSVDDQPALAALVAAVPARSKLVIPRGTYRLDSTWVIDRALTIDAAEATFVVNHPGDGIVFDRGGSSAFGGEGGLKYGEVLDLDMGTILRLPETQAGQNAGDETGTGASTGLRIVNSKNGRITARNIDGFRIGLHLLGRGQGVAYNTIFLPQTSCLEGLRCEAQPGGWVTANEFHGGRFGGSPAGQTDPNGVPYTASTNPNIRHIYMWDNGGVAAGVASNNFFGAKLEGFGRYGVVFNGAARNSFYEVWTELPHAIWAVDNLNGGSSNRFYGGNSIMDYFLPIWPDPDCPTCPKIDKIRDSATRAQMLYAEGAHNQHGYIVYYKGRFRTWGQTGGLAFPSNEVTFEDGGQPITRSLTGSMPTTTLPCSASRRYTIDVLTNVAAGSVTVTHVPLDGCEMEVTLSRVGATTRTIDPGFIAGIRYGIAPVPPATFAGDGTNARTVTYKLRITSDGAGGAASVQVVGYASNT